MSTKHKAMTPKGPRRLLRKIEACALARLLEGDVSHYLTDVAEVTTALRRIVSPTPAIPGPAAKAEGVPTRHGGGRGCRVIQRIDGEGWSQRSKRPFRIICCDCGLVHTMVLSIGKNGWIGIAAKREKP